MSEKEQKPPPCLDPEKCPRVAACLESSKLCHELGRVGSYRPCGIERRPLMTAVAVAAVLALLLNVYALFVKATSVVAHLALRAPGNPAEESVARRLAWISMD